MSLGLQFTIYHLSLHSFRIGLVFHSVMMTKGSQFTTKKLISLLTQHSHVVMILEAVGTVVCAHGPFSICPVLSSLPLGFGHHIFPTALCKVGNDTLDVVPNKLFSVLILFLCVWKKFWALKFFLHLWWFFPLFLYLLLLTLWCSLFLICPPANHISHH